MTDSLPPAALPADARPLLVHGVRPSCGACRHYTPEPKPRLGRAPFRCTSGGAVHGQAPFWAWFCGDFTPKVGQ